MSAKGTVEQRKDRITNRQGKIERKIVERVARDNPETVGEILDALPGAGHNQPPLEELLPEETKELRERAAKLIEHAGRAKVENDKEEAEATTLGKLIGDHIKLVDKAREERKAPFLRDGKLVDGHFGSIITPMSRSRVSVVNMLDAYRQRKDAEAREAQRKLDEAAEAKRKEAAALAAKAKETGAIEDEISARGAIASADRLERMAAVPVAARVVDTGYGIKSFGRKHAVHEVTDPLAFVRWMLKTNRAALIAGLHDLAKPFVGKVAAIPGVTVTEETKTVIR